MAHTSSIMDAPIKVINRETRIRIKNIHTGVSFEFSTLTNSARFVGTTDSYMRYICDQRQTSKSVLHRWGRVCFRV